MNHGTPFAALITIVYTSYVGYHETGEKEEPGHPLPALRGVVVDPASLSGRASRRVGLRERRPAIVADMGVDWRMEKVKTRFTSSNDGGGRRGSPSRAPSLRQG